MGKLYFTEKRVKRAGRLSRTRACWDKMEWQKAEEKWGMTWSWQAGGRFELLLNGTGKRQQAAGKG